MPLSIPDLCLEQIHVMRGMTQDKGAKIEMEYELHWGFLYWTVKNTK